jgi:hypothetical protein
MKYRIHKLEDISKISLQVTMISLTCYRLFEYKNIKQLTNIFKSIPPWVNGLILSYNGIGSGENIESFKECIPAIPPWITSIDLAENRLGQRTPEEWEIFLTSIPASVTSLNFKNISLGCKKNAKNLHKFFANIKPSVTNLNLSFNHLARISTEDLANALAAIPQNVIILDLSYNDLANKTAAELKKIFSKIPTSVTTINLSGNDLENKTTPELIKTLSYVPINVINLYLSLSDFSGLANKTKQELEQIFTAIHAKIKIIGISYYGITGNNLFKIPSMVTSLDLSKNNFGYKSTADLIHLFSSIPSSIKNLNLADNNLVDNKTIAELEHIITLIPITVININLSDNYLNRLTADDLQHLIESMPPTIQNIEFGFPVFNLVKSFKGFYFAFSTSYLTRYEGYKEIALKKTQGFIDNISSNFSGRVHNKIISFLTTQDVCKLNTTCKHKPPNNINDDDCIAFAEKYFERYFNTMQLFDLEQIKQEYTDYTISDFKGYQKFKHNIPLTEINQFILHMRDKYSHMSDNELNSYILNWFKIKPQENHFLKFYDPIDISSILNNLIIKKKSIQEKFDNLLQGSVDKETVDCSNNVDNSSTKRCRYI